MWILCGQAELELSCVKVNTLQKNVRPFDIESLNIWFQPLLVCYKPRSNDVIHDNKFPIGHGLRLRPTAGTQQTNNRNENRPYHNIQFAFPKINFDKYRISECIISSKSKSFYLRSAIGSLQ